MAAAPTPRLGGDPHVWAPAQTGLRSDRGLPAQPVTQPQSGAAQAPEQWRVLGENARGVMGWGARRTRGHSNPGTGEGCARAVSEGPRPDPAACPAAGRVVRPSAQTRLTGPLGCSDGVLIIVIADGNTGVWRRWGLVQNRPGPWGPCIRAQSRPPHCPRLCSRPCLPGPGPTTPPGTRAGSPVGTVPRHRGEAASRCQGLSQEHEGAISRAPCPSQGLLDQVQHIQGEMGSRGVWTCLLAHDHCRSCGTVP